MTNDVEQSFHVLVHLYNLWINVCSYPLPLGGILYAFFLFFHISDLSVMTRVACVIMNERIGIKAGCGCIETSLERFEGRATIMGIGSLAGESGRIHPLGQGVTLLEWQRSLWPWLRGIFSEGKESEVGPDYRGRIQV